MQSARVFLDFFLQINDEQKEYLVRQISRIFKLLFTDKSIDFTLRITNGDHPPIVALFL